VKNAIRKILKEEQEERFAERMGYIDKIIKNRMREGSWTYLENLVEMYGLSQEDVDIIGMIQGNILEGMVNKTFNVPENTPNTMPFDDEFTFKIDKVIPKTQNPAWHQASLTMFKDLDMNLPYFIINTSLVEWNNRRREEGDMAMGPFLDHIMDIIHDVIMRDNPILPALGTNIEFETYPI